MLGAIVGDIVGSRFEFNNHRSKTFDLFHPACFVTDDSIMTLAVAKSLMETLRLTDSRPGALADAFIPQLRKQAVHWLQTIGQDYPDCGYGGRFFSWIFAEQPQPYMSFGNGAAMRISPVAYVAASEHEVRQLSHAVTAISHDHPEGIKGAEATALATYWARTGVPREAIARRIRDDYYALDFRIDAIRATYRFNETCQETVPQAIACFLESVSFEDAIRNAISIGGDSDTVAAITGAIAAAYYGVPVAIREAALLFVDPALREIFDAWEAKVGAWGV